MAEVKPKPAEVKPKAGAKEQAPPPPPPRRTYPQGPQYTKSIQSMRDRQKRCKEITDAIFASTHEAIIKAPSKLLPEDVKAQPTTFDPRENAETLEKMLALESAFYQPNRWQSKYVRKLTTSLSIKDAKRRLREEGFGEEILSQAPQEQYNGNCHCQAAARPSVVNGCEEPGVVRLRNGSVIRTRASVARPTTMYFANDGVRTSTQQNGYDGGFNGYDCASRQSVYGAPSESTFRGRRESTFCNNNDRKMSIIAAHQFSTIKTIYNDDRKSYEGIVQPHKPMLVQVDFEISGEVSGVYFMKYAKSMADTLDIRGWIRVSPRGYVQGQLQGEKTKVDQLTLWLGAQGAPKARVSKCEFRNWHLIDACDFRQFTIRY